MNINFSAVDLRKYAEQLGWKIVPEALADGLFIMNHPELTLEQLYFSKDESAPDYERSLELTVKLLGEVLRVSTEEVISRIVTANDDILKFRLWGNGVGSGELKISFAADALSGTKNLLLAAAHSVLAPQYYHPRLTRREAVEFIDSAKFRYAIPSSFVFDVSCPLNSGSAQHSWHPHIGQAPFTRSVTLTTQKALVQIVQCIEEDTLDPIKIDTNSGGPLVSSNFCSALLDFHDQVTDNALDVDFKWAQGLPGPTGTTKIKIQKSYFSQIEQIQRELRSQERERKDIFIGFVEKLNGEPGVDNRRFGEVVMNLLVPEDERPIKARINLSADLYEEANKAHMKIGSYVIVIGTLREGRQPRLLEIDNDSDFEVHTASVD